MDSKTMTNNVFGEKSEQAIEVLKKRLGDESFKTEEEFLQKATDVLEEKLRHLRIVECMALRGEFWQIRSKQLEQIRDDKNYITYLISLLSEFNQLLLEIRPYELDEYAAWRLMYYADTIYQKEKFRAENLLYDELYENSIKQE